MIIPLIITAGILGTLYATRDTTPSKSDLDAEFARYGRIIAEGRGAEIDPARLDALAANMRRAGRETDATVAEGWALYVRNLRQGPMRDPAMPPPALPPGMEELPIEPAAPLPPELQARISMLTQQGEAASPFALEALANEIERVSPGNYAATALMQLAAANRSLMEANRAAAVGAYRAYSRQPTADSRQPGPTRCTSREGCLLYRTPSSLYPTNVTIPFMAPVAVLGQEGDWLHVLHGTQRGWVQRSQFSNDLLPGLRQ